jgi:hypothetical protein
VTLAGHAPDVKRPDARRKSFQRDDPDGNGDGVRSHSAVRRGIFVESPASK